MEGVGDSHSSTGSNDTDRTPPANNARKNNKRSIHSTNEGPNRSVVDYDTEEQLREAMYSFMYDSDDDIDPLLDMDDTNDAQNSDGRNCGNTCSAQLSALMKEIYEDIHQPLQKMSKTCDTVQQELVDRSDWIIPAIDLEEYHPQTVYDEIHRLQALKTFDIVDSVREVAFDRITSLASRIFDVPLSMVSLVDLGRQFYMSNHGFDKYGLHDMRDLPRKFAFCSHTILHKDNVLVVPDLAKDYRFIDHPFVANPPHVKFYAGAPLITPEGYKLGTICIIDVVARPNGLNEDEKSTLMDLAEMTMKVMVDRRDQLNNKKLKEKEVDIKDQTTGTKTENTTSNNHTQLLMAYTAHDMMAPLTSVHLSLSLLQNDLRHVLNDHQNELLNTASSCSELMLRICKTTLDGLTMSTKSTAIGSSASAKTTVSPAETVGSTSLETTSTTNNSQLMQHQKTTNLKNLVKSIQMIIDPIPKKVPCIVSLDKDVPNIIIADELKLFRCAVNLLTNAIDRTEIGNVHLTIDWDGESLLIFECEDTAPDIPTDEIQYLFQQQQEGDNSDSDSASNTNLRVGLSSIALLIDSIDGEYGFRPKDVDSEGNYILSPDGRRKNGSIFWFSIPILLPDNTDNTNTSHSNIPTQKTLSVNQSLEPIPIPLRTSDLVDDYRAAGVGYANNSCEVGIMNHFTLSDDGGMTLPPQSTDVDVMDELGKLALDLNASLTDFEPYPINTDISGAHISKAGTRTIASNPVVRNLRKRRALVIDDSVVVRRSLGQALSHLGYEVALACDGLEGLRELQKMLYDIVFIDFMMPSADGLSCVRKFRNWETINRSWDCQLIIGISVDASINNNGQGLHAGMNAFLPKPITVKTLADLECSSEFISRTRQLDEWEGNNFVIDATVSGYNTSSNQSGFNISSTQSMMEPQQQRSGITSTSTNSGIIAMSLLMSCLIATNKVNTQNHVLRQQLESMGWQVVIVNDGMNCLQLLKMQAWGAVLIDEDLPQLSGLRCIAAFRKWEGLQHTNRLMNIYLVCDGDIPSPSDNNSFIQPPMGCNGVLRHPVPWNDLQYLLMRNTPTATKPTTSHPNNNNYLNNMGGSAGGLISTNQYHNPSPGAPSNNMGNMNLYNNSNANNNNNNTNNNNNYRLTGNRGW